MISVTILVKNGERCLAQVLKAVQAFDEVICLDTGSTDKTLEIARSFPNVKIHQSPFTGFGPLHNQMARLAKHDWILSLDADEVLSPSLTEEILSLRLNPLCVYSLPFKNHFNGKHIRCCGWHPESHVRLYHREQTAFSEAFVHEGVVTQHLKTISLHHPVLHYPYESISDFLVKMERYSTLFANQYRGRRNASPLTAISHGVWAFFKSYLLKKGFLGGYEGFLISTYNAHTAFYKYLKLYHANVNRSDVSPSRYGETCQLSRDVKSSLELSEREEIPHPSSR